VEKSTTNSSELNAVKTSQQESSEKNICSILDPDCEACQ
jgi:hypothetical protein